MPPARLTFDAAFGAPPRLGEAAVLVTGVAVAAVALASLVLANAGAHHTGLALAAGALVALAGAAWWWRSGAGARTDIVEVVLVGVVAVLGAVLLLPGFPYLVGDKDPGVYAAHAMAIERTGGTAVDDPVLQRADEVPVVNYLDDHPLPARFPGYWVDPDDPAQVRPQFFHLLPSLLATAHGAGGTRALFNAAPVLAALAVLALALAVRRAAGAVPALLTALVLTPNMIQVWHGRHPSTEVLAQLFLACAGLALVLAVRAGRPGLSVVGGALATATFLARPDGLLVVVIGIAAAALLVGLGRGGAHPARFLVGLALPLPYAAYQAYHLNRTYMLANDLPDWPLVAAGAVAAAGGAVVLRRFVAPRWDAWADGLRRRVPGGSIRRTAAGVLGTVGAVLLVVAWYRPDLFDTVVATTFDGRRVPRLDEWNLRKLSWFLTVPGLVAMWAGFVEVLRRRSLHRLWLVILPGVLLFPLYVWEAHIESRLMWWSRRFVPAILPAMVVLIAVAVALCLRYRGRGQLVVRAAGAALAVGLPVVAVGQSLDVRGHREYGGSVELIEQVAGATGGPAVFLWQFPADGDPFDPARVLGGPVWFAHGQVSTLLAPDAGPAVLDAYARAFPDRQIVVVARGDEPPLPLLEGSGAEPLLAVDTALAHWEEADFERPDEARTIPFDFTLWAVS